MIGNRYFDFFQRTHGERVIVLRGGRRSGKTFATYQFLKALALLVKNKKITTLTATFSQMQKSIEDFEAVFMGAKVQRKIKGYSYTDNNGNIFEFIHCDKSAKMLGNQCDIGFVNEASTLEGDIFDTFLLGVRSFCILNFNPHRRTWIENYVRPDKSNLLITTFRDNKYLPESQLQSFERLKEKALSPLATPLDKYNYQVYYLGEYSTAAGSVFNNVSLCSERTYAQVPTREYLGFDFGFVVNGDPCALVGVKIYQKKIYCTQYIYSSRLNDNEALDGALRAAGIEKKTFIFADYGGMGKSRMGQMIREYGYAFKGAIKPNIYDNIEEICNYTGGICVTETSTALINELSGYEFDNGKFHGEDHAIDALRYAFNSAQKGRKIYKDQ